ncbi:glycosyltransferase [Chryseobacterium wangxinyae]|uniref:glycosyltransferase family 2 protein n=1 Tax=Chryseobacterium sp. CY350 TaxID=2997336 RepID=UPI002271C6A9|nr:glycosyltransferase [Chryseobacterium sp. CY350]MCY0975823.1 glycosyltransferase [Chryseobacterium sp. CY350]WBZ94568.1 glycosyltransferase [Chryseobacterium sp. CY350]
MNQPLVSIVVISYNQAKYIKENLDSLKTQTYLQWELIVADDASPDDSVEEFRNWLKENDVNAKELFHTKNTGLATVLNEALELCEGKYVKFIAADDYMHPECLEQSVKSLEEKSDEFGMVFSDTFCVDENSNLLPDFADYNSLGDIPAEDFRKEIIKGNRIAALTVMMRTDVVKETGKYDAQFIIEDYYRWLKINEKYLIAYIPQKLTYYRWHEHNISKTKTEKIDYEAHTLQIMFDHDGIAKDKINRFIKKKYIAKRAIPPQLFNAYSNYTYRIKRLKFCIQFGIPPVVYRIVSKFI